MSRKGDPNSKKGGKSMRIAGAGEVDLPKSDAFNVWDKEFGWVLKDGKPTVNTKAYWQKKRRELKN